MCGESTRPGEAVPGWDVSAIGHKTTWPRGMTSASDTALRELYLRRCVSTRRRRNREAGYAGSKMGWSVRHGDLETNESFAMTRRQDWKSFTSRSARQKKKKRSSESAKTPSFQEAQAFNHESSWHFPCWSDLARRPQPCAWVLHPAVEKNPDQVHCLLILRYLKFINFPYQKRYLIQATNAH